MSLRDALRLLAAGGALAAALPAWAQFSLAISPPRFELAAQPGAVVRDVIQLSSDDPRAGVYTVKTADWRLEPDGSATFIDELLPGSCRPWVAIERREVTVAVGRPYRFRFQVSPPPGTPPAECMFAIMLEGKPLAATPGSPPVSGRVAVIVYVAVGDVVPRLVVTGTGVETLNNQQVPVLHVRNEGTAHARLDGFLNGTDASGRKFEFAPSSFPILPGETRRIGLLPVVEDQAPPAVLRFPVAISGKLEWGKTRSTVIDYRFAP